MCTYFAAGGAKHFQSLTIDNDIETEPFLDASLGIAQFVGFFGAAFTPVKNDIEGNVQVRRLSVIPRYTATFCKESHRSSSKIKKLRNTYLKNPPEYANLKVMIDKEIAYRSSLGFDDIGYATEALLWLKRGLEYFLLLMQHFVEDYENNTTQESLVATCTLAYDRTLKRHHNFLAKGLFKLAVRAAPYRKDLMKLIALGVDNMEHQCIQDIKIYIRAMKANVDCVCSFYFEKNIEVLPNHDTIKS